MLDAAGIAVQWMMKSAMMTGDSKHVSGTLEGIGASSSGREPAVLIRDVDGRSSVGVDRIPVTSREVFDLWRYFVMAA